RDVITSITTPPMQGTFRIDYQMAEFRKSSQADQFVQWLQGSPSARQVMRLAGMLSFYDQYMTSSRVVPRSERALCVMAMLRSGTPFTARALQLLGVSLGRAEGLMVPGPDNPAGYWENRDVKELNDELLARLGGSWDQPPVLDPGWESDHGLDLLRMR